MHEEACVCVQAQGLSAPCSPLWSKNASRSSCSCARTGTFSTLLPIVEQKCSRKRVFVCTHRGFQRAAPHCGGGEQLTVMAIEVHADCRGALLANPSRDAARWVAMVDKRNVDDDC